MGKMTEWINKLEQTAEIHDFSGVVSVFREEETIYHAAFGYRDIKNQVPNDIDTKFGIASGTKVFTALGIGKLIDQRKLSLDTKASEIHADFHSFIDKEATILNLLSHTSGIYDYMDEEIIEDFDNFSVEIPWSQLVTPLDYLPLFQDKKMKFQPNERFSYSNGGFVFLGIIIEVITGRTYREFIETEVLQPAGMQDSGFYAFNDLPSNTANGYLADLKTTNIYQIPIRGGGDGGMYTTSKDVQNFWNQLFSYQILSKELTEIYLKTQYAFDQKFGYGCGIYKTLDNRMFYVVGSDAGVGFDSRYVVDQAMVINILSNRTDGEQPIREWMKAFLFNDVLES